MIKMSARLAAIITLSFGISVLAKPAPPVKAKPAAASAKVSTTSTSPVQESYFADFEYELQTMLSGAGIESRKIGTETYTIIEAQASLTKVIKSNIQAGAEAHFLNQSGGGGASYFEIMALGFYNLDNNLKESLYGKAGLGMLNVINEKGKNESKFGVLLAGGKRVPVMDKVAYTPEVRIILVDGSTRFQIMVLNFSLFY